VTGILAVGLPPVLVRDAELRLFERPVESIVLGVGHIFALIVQVKKIIAPV